MFLFSHLEDRKNKHIDKIKKEKAHVQYHFIGTKKAHNAYFRANSICKTDKIYIDIFAKYGQKSWTQGPHLLSFNISTYFRQRTSRG